MKTADRRQETGDSRQQTGDRSRIQLAEMRPLRAMVGKNEDIRKSIGVCSVLNKINASQLRDTWKGRKRKELQGDAGTGCQAEQHQEKDRERDGK